ncbi:hypothetical protein [Streptomyces sp. SAJ15]|uniref:hypothetical protein n=1 Tax=Streptomyces sp. SAJ15 TaxID=2011095 RepID=UPI001186B0AC|nr:hypothetical protein [Streptomyces sp. SAJ15]
MGEVILGLICALLGSGATMLAPAITARITKKHEREAEAEQREKRKRDVLFDRLVILRDSTREEVHEFYLMHTDSSLARHMSQTAFVHASVYTDIAQSVGREYPNVASRYFDYVHSLKSAHRKLEEARGRNGSLPWRRITDGTLPWMRWSSDAERRLTEAHEELKDKRTLLRRELQQAANDLGYEFLLSEEADWAYRMP